MTVCGSKKLNYRLILMGGANCGFLQNKFDTKYKPTIEDLFRRQFDLNCVELDIEFLDTSGELQFPAMRRISIANASAFLLVYAINDENSFSIIKMLLNEILVERANDVEQIPIIIAGNKSDLRTTTTTTTTLTSKVNNNSNNNKQSNNDKQANNNNQKSMIQQSSVDIDKVQHYIHCELPISLNAQVIECSCKENANIDFIFKTYLKLAKVNVIPNYLPPQQQQQTQQQKQQRKAHNSQSSANVVSSSSISQSVRNSNKPQTTSKSSTKTPPPISEHCNDDDDNYNDDDTAHAQSHKSDCSSTPTPTTTSNKFVFSGALQSGSASPINAATKRPSLRRRVALQVRKSCDASFISSIKSSIVDPILQAAAGSSSSVTCTTISNNNTNINNNNYCCSNNNRINSPLRQQQQQQPQQMFAASRPKSAIGNVCQTNQIKQQQHQILSLQQTGNVANTQQVNLDTVIRNELIKNGDYKHKYRHSNINNKDNSNNSNSGTESGCVGDWSKPRSRSLIWRSTRRSKHNSYVGECLPS